MYGDQFALFEADAPHERVRKCLVAAGWLHPELSDGVAALGLPYVGGAHFRLHFANARRLVDVSLSPKPKGEWLLSVCCYRAARSVDGDIPIPVRSLRFDGTPVVDELAPTLSYEVAAALHASLAPVVARLRWAIDREPDQLVQDREPVRPARPR